MRLPSVVPPSALPNLKSDRPRRSLRCCEGVARPGFLRKITIDIINDEIFEHWTSRIDEALSAPGAGMSGLLRAAQILWVHQRRKGHSAENEEMNPWEPFHVSLGFAKEDSTVTVTKVGSYIGAAGQKVAVHDYACGHVHEHDNDNGKCVGVWRDR